jgi:hypothetical protein
MACIPKAALVDIVIASVDWTLEIASLSSHAGGK